MQREIKFRAKAVEEMASGNQWAYGYGIYKLERYDNTEEWYIATESNDVWIAPETIGQYTGLKDKNGKEIWEGDIVRFIDGIKINGSTIHQSAVKWVEELSGFYIHADCVGYYQVNPSQCAMYHYEVIGTIYKDGGLADSK